MYPAQIERLHSLLSNLPGVTDIAIDIHGIQDLRAEGLSLPNAARLPIGALRRTAGGLDAEALIQVEFRVLPIETYWKTVEFLAWFVRDESRGGLSIQMRPFALPPKAGELVQLGHSLRWQIDLFCFVPVPGLSVADAPHLNMVEELARDLEFALEVYGSLLCGEDT